MELLHKTRGNSTPTRKPRVYFFSHPRDFDRYLDPICKDILEISNCAIWYKSDPNSFICTDTELTLGQMQLVVIPVTRLLLSDESVLRSEEFRFFFEKHIPILPVMQEINLSDPYRAVFQNRQYLSKFEIESNSIPYAKKMENFLRSVLIRDEMADRVRAEFNTHVFVSYRKIDRAYANEFMRLLHEQEAFEDVGIWYDEFLTPGENFNDEIENAISKCNVFSLVITPNTVKENNYITETEYPLAIANGKVVFPAVFVHTDKRLIEEKFGNMTVPVDAHDEAAFGEAFAGVLDGLKTKEKNDSDEHKYLIALAYISGIEVEVNVAKAILILTNCAQRQFLPAMEKLVDIYRRGQGVPVDHEKAIDLQKKIVGIKEKGPSDDEAPLDLVSALYTLSQLYLELYNFDLAAENLGRAIEVLDRIDDGELNEKAFEYYSLCYNQSALCYKMKNDTKTAARYYLDGIEFMKKHCPMHKDLVQTHLAELYNNLGTLLVDCGDYEYSMQYFKSAFSILLDIFNTSDEDKEGSAYGLAVMYNNVGAIAEQQGRESLGYYEQATELINRYLIDKKDLPYYQVASVIFMRAGIRYTKLGQYTEAEKMLNASLDCLNKILERSMAIEDLKDKANCYEHLATLHIAQGKIDVARDDLKNAIDVSESALGIADTPPCRRILSSVCSLLGMVLLAVPRGGEISVERVDQAREYYLKAIDVMQPVIENNFRRVTSGSADERNIYTREMVDDIEAVASSWDTLSRLDHVRVPTERAVLLYRWLTKICPDQIEYAEKLRQAEKRLQEITEENS